MYLNPLIIALAVSVTAFVLVFALRLWTIRRRHRGGTSKDRRKNAVFAGFGAFCFGIALTVGLMFQISGSVRAIVMVLALMGLLYSVSRFRSTEPALDQIG